MKIIHSYGFFFFRRDNARGLNDVDGAIYSGRPTRRSRCDVSIKVHARFLLCFAIIDVREHNE